MAKTPDMIPTVPRLWPGCTMVLLGDGPSLTRDDVDACHGHARVMAMNFSFRLAPWADVLWSYHTRTLRETSGVDPATYQGRIFSAEPVPDHTAWPILKLTGPDGLELDPRGLRHGNNSGYSAINLAVHLGAKRIVLLGFDCCAAEDGRFNFAKPANDVSRKAYGFAAWRRWYATLPTPLAAVGVTVVNASRQTALECFPRVSLEMALAGASLGAAA